VCHMQVTAANNHNQREIIFPLCSSMLSASWGALTKEMVAKCFRKTGFCKLPEDQEDGDVVISSELCAVVKT
jgi:hypothetical protein